MEKVKNTDEIVMEDSDEDSNANLPPKAEPTPVEGQNADEIVMDDEDEDLVESSKTETSAPVAEKGAEEVPSTATANEAPSASEEHAQGSSTAQPTSAELNDSSNSSNNTSQGKLPSTTKFLALDKCVPRRRFLEVSIL
jgi:lariat debranching enzyme